MSYDQLSKIILTHQDIDHIDNLPTFLAEAPHKIEVLASDVEKPFIEGTKRLVKLTPD